jgi:hypothetical protein
MAEGLLEGALGGEEERPDVEASAGVAGAEAFAAAIAAIASRQDPEVARDTSAFLKKQFLRRSAAISRTSTNSVWRCCASKRVCCAGNASARPFGSSFRS